MIRHAGLASRAQDSDHTVAAATATHDLLSEGLSMNAKICRFAAMAGFAAALAMSALQPAWSGEVATTALRAEQALDRGDSASAIEYVDDAVDALWRSMPLHLRTAVFAENGTIKAFGRYRPGGNVFQKSGTVTIYVEPVGYGFTEIGSTVSIRLTTSLQIRSPGGIVYARSPNFGRLNWGGRSKSREVHGRIVLGLPDLKPGDYEIVLGLSDLVTGKTAEAVMPFSIAP